MAWMNKETPQQQNSGGFGGYSVTQPDYRPQNTVPFWSNSRNQTSQTMNPYAAYQQSNRNVGWPSGQSAQQLQQSDWQRNYDTLTQMGVNPQTSGVFAGAPSQAVPLLGLQESATQNTNAQNMGRINTALQSLQQAQGNVGGRLGPQITQNYQQLLSQGSALPQNIRNQMVESQFAPQINSAYNAQQSLANSMSGPARDLAMQRAQETRQNRILESQRELAIKDAQDSFMQRLLANQQAGQYQSGLNQAQQPYIQQGALINSTAAQQQAPDYSGLLNLIMGGQSLTRYQPQMNIGSGGNSGVNWGAGSDMANMLAMMNMGGNY